jgi:hypothetical protein
MGRFDQDGARRLCEPSGENSKLEGHAADGLQRKPA